MLIRFLLLFLLCGHVHAQVPVTLDPALQPIALGGNMAWLKDAAGTLTVEQAVASDAWQPLSGEPGFGFTSAAIWLRLEVFQPPDGTPAWRLQTSNALLENVRLYLHTAEGTWQVQRSGRAIFHDEWPLNTRSPTFRLDLPPGTHQALLRLASRNSLSTSISLWETEQFHVTARDEAMLWGAYFGVYGLVILFQFFFWRWTRESLSGWYVPYAGLNFLGMCMNLGYPQNVFGWGDTLATPLMGILICATLGVGSKFSSVQLELHRVMPRFNRWLVRGGAGLAALACLLVLMGRYGTGVSATQILSIIWMLGLFGISIRLSLRGHGPANFFLASFGVFYLGVLIRYLRNLGLIEPSLWNDYSVQAGSLLHMLLMCLFIVYRYNGLKVALQIEQKARQEQRDFIAMVTHEYRTPLAIIGASAHQLAANLDAPREKTLRRCTNIRNAAQRMSNLFDQYLSTEYLEEADQPLHPSRCNPSALLTEIVAEWPSERVRLTLDRPPQLLTCDTSLLAIALRNLLFNANRHAPPDTVIEVAGTGDGRAGLRISVTNLGDEIPDDEIPRLFQKYFRGRASSSTSGAGLGLFLVKRIADLHGSQVEVNSTEGKTTFSLSLPGNLPDYGMENRRLG